MLRIWGHTKSSNVMKVLWLCDELSIAHERLDAGGAFGKVKEPAYLAMNPNARVPTIEEEGGFVLWESNSILRYLAATRAPGHAVYPADPRARARVERWMDWQLAHLGPPMGTLFLTLVRTPEPQRDMAAVGRARGEAEGLWRMVETELADGRPYLCGAALTLADIALGPYLHRWMALGIDRGAPMPALAGWYERLKAEHAGFRTHLAIPLG
jgi:glutathione S-transferase